MKGLGVEASIKINVCAKIVASLNLLLHSIPMGNKCNSIYYTHFESQFL